MTKKTYILLHILLFSFSCQNTLTNKDYDKKVTKEFIKQLIESEKKSYQEKSFLSSNCILEQPSWNSFDNKLKLKIEKELGIKDKAFLVFQIDLFQNFLIEKEMIPDINIIKNEEYTEFKQSFNNNEFAYLNKLDRLKCKYGFSSISKPLFNENYDLAIIRFEKICGPLCGGGLISVYEIKKGKWKQKKILDSWIY